MNSRPYKINSDKFGNICSVKMSRVAACMCPQCYDIYMLKSEGSIELKSDELSDLIVTPKLHAECKCGFIGDMIFLDAPIADCVRRLNKLGYRTEMSCCGHSDENDKHLFIKFSDPIIFTDLPKGWTIKDTVFLESTLQQNIAINNMLEWISTLKSKYPFITAIEKM